LERNGQQTLDAPGPRLIAFAATPKERKPNGIFGTEPFTWSRRRRPAVTLDKMSHNQS